MEDNKMCKNCGKLEHCKWVIKGTYYCDCWQAEEIETKLVSKLGDVVEIEKIN